MHPFSESMGSFVRLRELTLSLSKVGVECYIFTPYERSFDLSSNIHVVSLSESLNTFGLAKALYGLSKLLYYSKAFPRIFSKTDIRSNKLMEKLITRMAKQLVKHDIDLIQVEQDAALPFGIGLKEKTGFPLIADLHNISSEELVSAGVLERKSSLFSFLQDMTELQLSVADHVVVVSESMKDYVVANYNISNIDVSVIPPGGRLVCDKSVMNRSCKPSKIVYAGLVAYREHVDLFVKSMPFVLKQVSDVQFYITNKGEAIKNVKRLSNNIGVHPEFFWYNDYEAVNQFLSSCHVGVLPSSNNVARQMGTPAKLFNYLSVGLPIVANDIGGWTKIIKDNQVGIVTHDNPESFASGILQLLENPQLINEYGQNGIDLVKRELNYYRSAEKLLTLYKNLV